MVFFSQFQLQLPNTPSRRRCENCRKQKKGCDRGEPCSGCRYKKITCTYIQQEVDTNFISDKELKYEEAEPLYRKMLESENPDTATSLTNLANAYYNEGKYEEAKPLYQEALMLREKALGLEHEDTITSLKSLADNCFNQGKYEEAESLYQQVYSVLESAHSGTPLND